ncbi:MAG: DEAD/DEAH box helicase family protein [Bdellovibrionaceae bacterium]|nr:DEAD/DEAH box helicase family protein [Pseudobdellovibrionaceae bacterium]
MILFSIFSNPLMASEIEILSKKLIFPTGISYTRLNSDWKYFLENVLIPNISGRVNFANYEFSYDNSGKLQLEIATLGYKNDPELLRDPEKKLRRPEDQLLSIYSFKITNETPKAQALSDLLKSSTTVGLHKYLTVKGSLEINASLLNNDGRAELLRQLRSLFRADPFLHPYSNLRFQNSLRRDNIQASAPQAEALDQLVSLEKDFSLLKKHEVRSALLMMPTGLGKTVTTILYLKELHKKGLLDRPTKIIIVYENLYALNQLLRNFQSELSIPDDKVLKIYGGLTPNKLPNKPDFQIVVTSRTGYYKKLEYFNKLVADHPEVSWFYFFDEMHHLGTQDGQFESILNGEGEIPGVLDVLDKNDRILYVSATPWHQDKHLISQLVGQRIAAPFLNADELKTLASGRSYDLQAHQELIHDLTRAQLFRAIYGGYLSPSNHFEISDHIGKISVTKIMNDTELVTTEDEMLRQLTVHEPIIKHIANRILANREPLTYDNGLIYVPTIHHANLYAGLLNRHFHDLNKGGNFRPYHSKLPQELKEINENWFVHSGGRGHKYLIVVDSIKEAADIPTVNLIVNARVIHSFRSIVQIYGRGVRPFIGKTGTRLIDLTGSFKHLITPDIAYEVLTQSVNYPSEPKMSPLTKIVMDSSAPSPSEIVPLVVDEMYKQQLSQATEGIPTSSKTNKIKLTNGKETELYKNIQNLRTRVKDVEILSFSSYLSGLERFVKLIIEEYEEETKIKINFNNTGKDIFKQILNYFRLKIDNNTYLSGHFSLVYNKFTKLESLLKLSESELNLLLDFHQAKLQLATFKMFSELTWELILNDIHKNGLNITHVLDLESLVEFPEAFVKVIAEDIITVGHYLDFDLYPVGFRHHIKLILNQRNFYDSKFSYYNRDLKKIPSGYNDFYLTEKLNVNLFRKNFLKGLTKLVKKNPTFAAKYKSNLEKIIFSNLLDNTILFNGRRDRNALATFLYLNLFPLDSSQKLSDLSRKYSTLLQNIENSKDSLEKVIPDLSRTTYFNVVNDLFQIEEVLSNSEIQLSKSFFTPSLGQRLLVLARHQQSLLKMVLNQYSQWKDNKEFLNYILYIAELGTPASKMVLDYFSQLPSVPTEVLAFPSKLRLYDSIRNINRRNSLDNKDSFYAWDIWFSAMSKIKPHPSEFGYELMNNFENYLNSSHRLKDKVLDSKSRTYLRLPLAPFNYVKYLLEDENPDPSLSHYFWNHITQVHLDNVSPSFAKQLARLLAKEFRHRRKVPLDLAKELFYIWEKIDLEWEDAVSLANAIGFEAPVKALPNGCSSSLNLNGEWIKKYRR